MLNFFENFRKAVQLSMNGVTETMKISVTLKNRSIQKLHAQMHYTHGKKQIYGCGWNGCNILSAILKRNITDR